MIITTTITFFLPKEHKAEVKFQEEHPDWTYSDSTGMRTYKKTVFKEEEDD